MSHIEARICASARARDPQTEQPTLSILASTSLRTRLDASPSFPPGNDAKRISIDAVIPLSTLSRIRSQPDSVSMAMRCGSSMGGMVMMVEGVNGRRKARLILLLLTSSMAAYVNEWSIDFLRLLVDIIQLAPPDTRAYVALVLCI